jgi:hypothetical protein
VHKHRSNALTLFDLFKFHFRIWHQENPKETAGVRIEFCKSCMLLILIIKQEHNCIHPLLSHCEVPT